jgi:hypothetical protein
MKTDLNVKKDNMEFQDFLLQDYQYYAECFWKSEESGENKINFFISLVSAIMAAVVLLLTNSGQITGSLISEDFVLLIVYFALIALIIFGFLTFTRIVKRNKDSDGYKKDMDRIRKFFKYSLYKNQLNAYEIYHEIKPRKIFTGGIADIVIILNAIVVSVIFAFTKLKSPIINIIISGLTGFIFVFSRLFIILFDQYEVSYYKLKKEKRNKEKDYKKKALNSLIIIFLIIMGYIFVVLIGFLIGNLIGLQLIEIFFIIFDFCILIFCLILLGIAIKYYKDFRNDKLNKIEKRKSEKSNQNSVDN